MNHNRSEFLIALIVTQRLITKNTDFVRATTNIGMSEDDYDETNKENLTGKLIKLPFAWLTTLFQILQSCG